MQLRANLAPGPPHKIVPDFAVTGGNPPPFLYLFRPVRRTEMRVFGAGFFFVVRFVPAQGAIGELLLRDLYVQAKDIRAPRAVCVTSGAFTEQAQGFVSARMIDLVEKDDLFKLLKKLSER